MAFLPSFLWRKWKSQDQAQGLYPCVLPRGLTLVSPGPEIRLWQCRGVHAAPGFACSSTHRELVAEDQFVVHVTTWESIAKTLCPYHRAGWRSAGSNPRFSKLGRDWLWTSNKLQTQKSANKLIKHSWEWHGQQSAETPQTHCPVQGLPCFSLFMCQYSSTVPGSDASMSTSCFPWAGKAVVAHGGKERVVLHGVFSPTLGWFCCCVAGRVCVALLAALSVPLRKKQNNWFSFPAICSCPCSGVVFGSIMRVCKHL